MREIELKAKVSDVDGLLAKLKKLDIVFSQPVTQKDIVYGMLKADGWVHGKQWFRLRTEQIRTEQDIAEKVKTEQCMTEQDKVELNKSKQNKTDQKKMEQGNTEQVVKHIFTMKRTLGDGLDSLEYETVVESRDAVLAILEDIGYEHYCTITKTRRKATYMGFEICLDKVEELDGNFIEVEKMVDIDASHDEVVKEIRSFMQSLGIDLSDEIDVGYDVMVLKKQNLAT